MVLNMWYSPKRMSPNLPESNACTLARYFSIWTLAYVQINWPFVYSLPFPLQYRSHGALFLCVSLAPSRCQSSEQVPTLNTFVQKGVYSCSQFTYFHVKHCCAACMQICIIHSGDASFFSLGKVKNFASY